MPGFSQTGMPGSDGVGLGSPPHGAPPLHPGPVHLPPCWPASPACGFVGPVAGPTGHHRVGLAARGHGNLPGRRGAMVGPA
eukprot:14290147-Alexandrium_andersonii.AAC.1